MVRLCEQIRMMKDTDSPRDIEARGIMVDDKPIVVVYIQQLPFTTDQPRFKAWIEGDVNEFIATGLTYPVMDAAVDCWLDGYKHAYDRHVGRNV